MNKITFHKKSIKCITNKIPPRVPEKIEMNII